MVRYFYSLLRGACCVYLGWLSADAVAAYFNQQGSADGYMAARRYMAITIALGCRFRR